MPDSPALSACSEKAAAQIVDHLRKGHVDMCCVTQSGTCYEAPDACQKHAVSVLASIIERASCLDCKMQSAEAFANLYAAKDKRIAELEEENIGYKALIACFDLRQELEKCGFDLDEWKRRSRKGDANA